MSQLEIALSEVIGLLSSFNIDFLENFLSWGYVIQRSAYLRVSIEYLISWRVYLGLEDVEMTQMWIVRALEIEIFGVELIEIFAILTEIPYFWLDFTIVAPAIVHEAKISSMLISCLPQIVTKWWLKCIFLIEISQIFELIETLF